MQIKRLKAAAEANFLRYRKGSTVGHYESYFIRANHPTEPKAFWIRYTIFAPKKAADKAVGELWAVYFEEDAPCFATKVEVPIDQCRLETTHFNLEIGKESCINSHEAIGSALDFSWNLSFESKEDPLFFLPLHFYELPFPKAKSLVPQPFARFKGTLQLGAEQLLIQDWIGSQNHNWGVKHTDYYAWGQVVGFDNAPDTFLEIISAQLKMGRVKTPIMTIIVLRHRGKAYRLNAPLHWLRSKARYKYFKWQFESENKAVKIKGTISAKAEHFVGLRYPNPPGGEKYCLNSKLASCELTVAEKGKLGITETLYSAHRAAFEILTNDKQDHGLDILF